jgi:tripartite ATP-independent transporter DctM subunit
MGPEFVVPIVGAILLFSCVPIGMVMLIVTFIGFAFFTDMDLMILGQTMVIKLDNFAFTAVLFFILAGNIMSHGGIVTRLINFTNKIVGFIRGGLAISAVCAHGLFGAISGSDLAALASVSNFMIPALQSKKYPRQFSIGLMTSSAILAIIIPPSIPMLIIASITGDSIARLFMAGFLPGIMIVVAFSIYCYFASRKFDEVEKLPFPTFKDIVLAFKDAFWALMTPCIIMVGILSGFCTASEAAGIAAAYAIFVEACIYKEIKRKDWPDVFLSSGVTMASVLILVAGASALADYVTLEQVAVKIMDSIVRITDNQYYFLLLVNGFLLIVGCLLEIISAMLILMPIFAVIVPQFHIDITHFSLIFILNLGIGYLTPPVGINLYLVMSLTGESLYSVCKAVVPTLLILIVMLLLVTYVPEISLFLPRLFGMM